MNNTSYSAGTISVGASSTTVTGAGTAWANSGIRAGDLFTAAGLAVPIQSVNSNTSITLKRPWPGAAQSAANYDILLLDDDVRSLVAANELLQALKGGNLSSFSQLAGGANKLPYFSGTGVLAQTDLTPFARTLLDDADAAAFWATIGATSGPAQAFRRGNVLGTVTQSGGVPTGALIERGSNANGEYAKFADGTLICTKHINDLGPINNPSGSLYASSTVLAGAYAAPFIADPAVAISNRSTNSVWIARNSVGGPSYFGNFCLLSAGPLSGTNYSVTILAVGRWF